LQERDELFDKARSDRADDLMREHRKAMQEFEEDERRKLVPSGRELLDMDIDLEAVNRELDRLRENDHFRPDIKGSPLDLITCPHCGHSFNT
jgi:hypothetical protein